MSTVTLFNKGERDFTLVDGLLKPKTAKEVDAKVAEKLLKMYPTELIEGTAAPANGVVGKLKAELEAKDVEIAELKAALKAKEAPKADTKAKKADK